MRPAEKEWIPLSEAEEKAKEMGITLSKPTIRKYGKQLGFGVQVGVDSSIGGRRKSKGDV